MSKCVMESFKGAGDPLHQHDDGTWWFADECWSDCVGPFSSEMTGREGLRIYCEVFLGPKR